MFNSFRSPQGVLPSLSKGCHCRAIRFTGIRINGLLPKHGLIYCTWVSIHVLITIGQVNDWCVKTGCRSVCANEREQHIHLTNSRIQLLWRPGLVWVLYGINQASAMPALTPSMCRESAYPMYYPANHVVTILTQKREIEGHWDWVILRHLIPGMNERLHVKSQHS